VRARKLRAMADIAFQYNPEARCCDVVFNGTDFAFDETPASAMLFSILAKRRANPDDTLPSPIDNWSEPASFTARGGTPCDALDQSGQLSGSRVWLYDRSDNSEETRQGVESAIAESVAWLETIRGLALSLRVRWVASQILGFKLQAGNTVLQLRQAIGA
jgi:phage gp46-like protein